MPDTTINDLSLAIDELTKDFKQANTDVKSKIDNAVQEAEKGNLLSDKALKSAEQAAEKVTELADELVSLQQEIGSSIKDKGQAPQSMGEVIVAQEAFKQFASSAGTGSSVRIDLPQSNTLTGQKTGGDSDDTLVQTQRKPGIIPGYSQVLVVADLLTRIPTSSNAYEFVREKKFDNKAAETAEGAAKPESDLEFESASVMVRTIPHTIKATRQILDDAPMLAAYIDSRLTYGVKLREDNQLLNGKGTGQELSGMTLAANRVAYAPVAASGSGTAKIDADTAIDSLNRAKYKLMTSAYRPEAIIMNPKDWSNIELMKDANNNYLVGDPFGVITPIMWGLPVVVSTHMTEGNFHMANFSQTYDLVDRQSVTVEMGYVNDDFKRNLVTIRAEERVALATLRADAALGGKLVA